MSDSRQEALMPVELFNAVTEYISSRPYREVHQLIDAIRQGVRVVDVPEEKTEETEDGEGF